MPSERLKQFYQNGTLPFIIGTTGHRNPARAADEKIRKSTREFLSRAAEEWARRTRPSSDAPLLVLNGLAEGADWLVAEIVLAEKKENPNSPLKFVAVIPFEKSEYEKDFETEEALASFRKYWDPADANIELALSDANRKRVEAGEPIERAEQYCLLGDFLATNSGWLLALWDGDCSKIKPGGTAYVVQAKLEDGAKTKAKDSERRDRTARTATGRGVVCQIATPRAEETNVVNPVLFADGNPFDSENFAKIQAESENGLSKIDGRVDAGRRFLWTSRRGFAPVLSPQDVWKKGFKKDDARFRFETAANRLFKNVENAVKSWRASFKGRPVLRASEAPIVADDEKRSFFMAREAIVSLEVLARINVDRALLNEALTDASQTSRKYLLPEESRPRDDDCDWRFLLEQFGFFDAAARHFQTLFLQTARRYLRCFVLSSLCFAVCTYGYALSAPVKIGLGVAYLGFLGALIALYFFESEKKYNVYHRRYRTLAEALRFQIFWNLGGIERSIMDYYWNARDDELEALRAAMKTILIPTRAASKPNVELARKYWAEDQRGWFQNKSVELRQRAYFWNSIGWIFSVGALGWLAFRVYAKSLYDTIFAESSACSIGYMIGSCFGVFAGSSFLWNGWNGYSALFLRYENMVALYKTELENLDVLTKEIRNSVEGGANETIGEQDVKDWLFALGESAQEENADWFLQPRKLVLPR